MDRTNLRTRTELDKVLSRLFESAQSKPKSVVKTKLKGGLIITMTVVNDCVLDLSIRRESVYPSAREWVTVLDHMPWPCQARPTMTSDNKMTASLAIHPKLL